MTCRRELPLTACSSTVLGATVGVTELPTAEGRAMNLIQEVVDVAIAKARADTLADLLTYITERPDLDRAGIFMHLTKSIRDMDRNGEDARHSLFRQLGI